ncbi:arginine N-methyltransferase, type III, putative [Trypanosoma cruzi marinkellei]|uniref:Arginine N-methyltransferase, type III, putative n=1 Tax=Trypanosoma cruzi marinkellei TaxID=85056 RepID=K2MQJ1_TRYCR|nr:arginine N-methyltransferase, type III, putative [Trypanosoma cruzi marinkellei]
MWKLEPVPTVRYEKTYALAGLRWWAPCGHAKRFPAADADGTARRVDQGWFVPQAAASKWIAAHGAAAMKFERSPALPQPRPIVGETQRKPPLQWVFAPACSKLLAASHAAEHVYYYGTGVFLLAAVAPVGAWTTAFWQATLPLGAGVAPAAVTAPRDHSTKEPSPGKCHTAAECAPASAARKMAAGLAQEQKRQSEPRVSAAHLLALLPPPAASPTG